MDSRKLLPRRDRISRNDFEVKSPPLDAQNQVASGGRHPKGAGWPLSPSR